MTETNYLRQEVKLYESDIKELKFAMKQIGTTKRATAIKVALKAYREYADLLATVQRIDERMDRLEKILLGLD